MIISVYFSETQSNKLFLLLCLFARYSANRHFQEKNGKYQTKAGRIIEQMQNTPHYGVSFEEKERRESLFTYSTSPLPHCSFQLIHWHFRCQDVDLHQSHTGVRDQAVFEALINNQ